LNGINQATSALKASVATLNDTVEKQKSLLEIADDVLPIIVWYHLGAILHYMGFNAWAFEHLKAVHLVTLETPSHESGDVLSFAAGLMITAAIFHQKIWSLLKKLGAV
jgi:hypothetical protein